jgi:hypothetical protein
MAGVCVLLLGPLPALAHEIVPGVMGFASLVLHPFTAVETILVIGALAFAVGSTECPALVPLCCLPAVAGGMLGAALQVEALLWPGLWRLPLFMGLALGAFAASGRSAGTWGSLAITFIAAATVGLGVIPEEPGLTGRLKAGAAAAVAIIVGLIVLALPRTFLRHAIARLATRVVAAWIVAIAALGLSVSLR